MPALYTSLTPNYIYTKKGEPDNASVSNRIVFELCNISTTAIDIKNEAAKEYTALPSYEEIDSQPIDGLSCVYLHFPIGTDDNCLTDADAFSKITIHQPQNWYCQSCGTDTLIFYPAQTISLAPGCSTEFILDHISTKISRDTISVCHIKYSNMEPETTSVFETQATIYKKRCPLSICSFAPDLADIITGFRDSVTLSWIVTGADKVILNPGNSQQDTQGSCLVSIYKKAFYTLTAYCNEEQISQSIFLEPLTASISSLTHQIDHDSKIITFSYHVTNTRHIFFTQKGRIPVDASGKGSFTVPLPAVQTNYTLTVENENGLVSQTVTIVPPAL